MLQRDHIMRQIQQASQVVQRLLGLREDEQYQQAQKEVDEVLNELLDLGPGRDGSLDLSHLSEEQLIETCRGTDGTLSTDLAVALAELLEQRELISSELGDEEVARKSRRFALTLYERSMAQEDAALPLNVVSRVERLQERHEAG